jgi:hypothetical protein
MGPWPAAVPRGRAPRARIIAPPNEAIAVRQPVLGRRPARDKMRKTPATRNVAGAFWGSSLVRQTQTMPAARAKKPPTSIARSVRSVRGERRHATKIPAQSAVTPKYAVRMPGALIPVRGPTTAVVAALLTRRYAATAEVHPKNAARRR